MISSLVSRAESKTSEPVARVVLLGASNLRLSRLLVLRLILERLAGPINFFVADGFGRSYGNWSSIPGRALPGIKECELWTDLRRSPSLPTFAMLTDVGNDLLYGASPHELTSWVAECISSLRALDANIIVTELPISSILATSSLRFKIFRTIFFPPSQLSFEEASQQAQDTNDRLRELVKERGCASIEMQKTWYGFDPIHVLRRHRLLAWQHIIDRWLQPSHVDKTCVFSFKNSVSIKSALPRRWRILGRESLNRQPATTLIDGSTLSVY